MAKGPISTGRLGIPEKALGDAEADLGVRHPWAKVTSILHPFSYFVIPLNLRFCFCRQLTGISKSRYTDTLYVWACNPSTQKVVTEEL